MRNATMKAALVAITLTGLVGCNADRRPATANADPAWLQSQLRAAQQERDKAKEELKACRVSCISEENDPRKCTLEFAKRIDPATLERVTKENAEARERFDRRVQGMNDLVTEAERLPAAPAIFGTASVVNLSEEDTLAGMEPYFYKEKNRCTLRSVHAGGERLAFEKKVADWRLLAHRGITEWNEIAVRDNAETPDREGFNDENTGILLTVYGDIFDGETRADKRKQADRQITVLAKGGPALQWLVGLIASHVDAKGLEYNMRRLRHLHAATSVNFADLDRKTIAAEAEAQKKFDAATPEEKEYKDVTDYVADEYRFSDGNYYKGLLLRYWRWKEFYKKGDGDVAIKSIRTVIEGVAKGMNISL